MEKEARKSQLNGVGHNHSRDSAIDADLQELETETVQVDIVRIVTFNSTITVQDCTVFSRYKKIIP